MELVRYLKRLAALQRAGVRASAGATPRESSLEEWGSVPERSRQNGPGLTRSAKLASEILKESELRLRVEEDLRAERWGWP